MQKVVDGVKKFLDPETKKKYKNNGFEYCRKICAYGPPGTGKSKLICRIAGEYSLPLYYLNCHTLSDHLSDLFDNVQCGIIVIEEMDQCISYSEDKESKEFLNNDNTVDKKNIEYKNKNCPSITELHAILDQILGSKVIVYMTTNNYDILEKINHGSIIRPGRVDQTIYIGTITKKYINILLQKYFKSDTKYFGKDSELPAETNLTPADIINIIKESNDNIDIIKNSIITRNTEKSKETKNN